jgi:hypothetical protein
MKNEQLGAARIKTVLGLLVLAAIVFAVIKIAPVYIEEKQLIHDVDELARVSALRGYDSKKINEEIAKLEKRYDLSEGSINIESREKGAVKISIRYNVPINLLVTTYIWKVDYVAEGKEF